MKKVAWTLSFVALCIYGTILNGWALAVLWKLFAVTIFGLPKLSILQTSLTTLQIAGLYLLPVLTNSNFEKEEQDFKKIIELFLFFTFTAGAFVLCGLIICLVVV